MKTLKLLIPVMFFPLVFHAQKTLTGLWIGTLSNDSTTIRKDQAFEIALTQYKDKVYGYSRSTFIINDTLYYILKRVKGSIEGEMCEVKDDEIISFNFPGRLDKGVKVTTTFRKNQQDSTWYLSGDWKTNKTKKYYAISGKVELKGETDFSKSKIFPHLEELRIDSDVEFYAASKKKEPAPFYQTSPPVNKEEKNNQRSSTAIAKSGGKEKTLTQPKPDPAKKESNPIASIKNENTKQEESLASDQPVKNNDENIAATSLKKPGLPASTLPAQEKKKLDNDLNKPTVKQDIAVKVNEPILSTTIPEQNADTKKVDPSALAKMEQQKSISNGSVQPVAKVSSAAAFVSERKTVAPQVLEFKSDSLEIKLYDNGEIDGDTVSVLLNGEILLAKQGLKASAIKKTIYIQPGQNELNLVLYAENLGKYPPNTGLLVVNDGEDTYQLRFSADLQQNAAIVFRRKK